jgi:hypothetical protein
MMIEATKEVVDTFDLEQRILDAWRVVDDLKIISDLVSSGSQDDVKITITGLGLLYDQKFTKLFETFEKLVADRKITS